MQIKASTFKTNTVDSTGSTGAADAAQQEEALNGSIEDFFTSDVDGTDSSSMTGNADPLDDYTLGDLGGGTTGAGSSTTGLEGIVPDINTLIENVPHARDYLDIVKVRYEQLHEDLSTLKIQYEQAIKSGTLSTDQIAELQGKLATLAIEISFCSNQLQKIPDLMSTDAAIYEKELKTATDWNNDNWIGRPAFRGSLRIVECADGSLTHLDAMTGKPVPTPTTCPDYQAQITSGDGLNLATEPDAEHMNDISFDSDTGRITTMDGNLLVDLNLSIDAYATNRNGLGNDDNFNRIDLGVPEYFWVERDLDVDGFYAFEDPNEVEEYRLKLYNKWDDSDGIRQKVPENRSDYLQVQVTKVVMRSVEIDDDSGVAHHYVEYFGNVDGAETLICRMRIEGQEESAEHPAAHNGYIAASTVGFHLHGKERATPVEVNATGMISTGRSIFKKDIPDEGVTIGDFSAPSDAGGERAWKENVESFYGNTPTSCIRKDGNSTEVAWTNDSDAAWGWNGIDYGNYNDCYVTTGMENVIDTQGATLSTVKTGLVVTGLRGDFKLTNYNDWVEIPDVNEPNAWTEEHMPRNVDRIMKGDPFDHTFVDSQNGNDVVISGTGTNYIFGATCVLGKGDHNTTTYIAPPNGVGGKEGHQRITENARVFIDVRGNGTTQVDNVLEWDDKAYAEAAYADDGTEGSSNYDASNGYDKIEDLYDDDDYFYVEGTAQFTNDSDQDIAEGSHTGSGAMDEATMRMEYADAMQAWLDELYKIPEVDQAAIESDWSDVTQQTAALNEELDSFFDCWGDILGEFDDAAFIMGDDL